MTRRNAAGTMPGEALALDVDLPARPALRVEVAGRGSLVLRQNDTVVLMAQVDSDHCGVEYASTGRFHSPVPPIRAAQAASFGIDDPGGVQRSRWAHHFATALTASPRGPLHTGRWAITTEATHLRATFDATTLAGRWEELLLPSGRNYMDWFTHSGAWQILPMRPLADPYTGRVKAYRKQAKDGILAPILLWWISGLDCYVLLDGHDRLVAALAENLKPPLLSLSSVNADQIARDREDALTRYVRTSEALERQVAAGAPGAADALAAVNQRLAQTLKTVETAYGITRAFPLRGGTARWRALATTHVRDWPAGPTRA